MATLSLTDIVSNSSLSSSVVNALLAAINHHFDGTTAGADVILKGDLAVDNITEATGGSGVTIDGLLIKDNGIVGSGTLDIPTQIITTQYVGSPTVDGSFRLSIDGVTGALIFEKRISGNWLIATAIDYTGE
jgi:hypothetical protein